MDEPLSSQATTIGGGVSTTFHQDDPSSGEYAQAAPSFSTSRKNAVASSSSSRVNAPASSSRSYGPPPSEASSSRLRPNVDQGPSYPSHLLSDLEASIPVDTGFDELHPAALSHLMEELDARHAELRAEVNRLKHNNVEDPKKSAGEGEEHPTTYTEADVPGFVEMLSSEEIELFEHAALALREIAHHQKNLVHNAVLVYFPYIVSLLPSVADFRRSETTVRLHSLVDLIYRTACACGPCLDELEEHLDIEFLVKCLKKTPEHEIQQTGVELLNRMLEREAELIRGGGNRKAVEGDANRDRLEISEKESMKDEEAGVSEMKGDEEMNGPDEWADIDGNAEGPESVEGEEYEPNWALEGKITELLHVHFYRFETLDSDVAGGNNKGKGKAKATHTLRWNTADALNAITSFEFAVTTNLTNFTIVSLEAGTLDFLLLIATTSSTALDATLSPTLTDLRAAAISCISIIYFRIAERSLVPQDFPYDCNTDADDARFELQGRILMPLLDLLSDPDDDPRVSDKVVELLYDRFDDLDQSVQIYLWSHAGSVENLVGKCAMEGVDKAVGGKGKGKQKANVPGGFEGLAGTLPRRDGCEWNGSSTSDILARGIETLAKVNMLAEAGAGGVGKGKGKGKQIRDEALGPSPIEIQGNASLVEKQDVSHKGKGKGKEKASANDDWDVLNSAHVQTSMFPRSPLKRSYADMLDLSMGGEPPFPHKKPSLPRIPTDLPLPQITPADIYKPKTLGPQISDNILQPILGDTGTIKPTQSIAFMLLNRLIVANPKGSQDAMKAFWNRTDLDDATREGFLSVTRCPFDLSTIRATGKTPWASLS